MRKSIKIGFPIICIGIIIVTFIMLNDIKKKAELSKDTNKRENTENVEDNSVKNNIENTINNEVTEEDRESFFGSEIEVNMNKAMYIFKNQYQINDEYYYLTSEGEEKGRYIIAIRNKETTEVEQYYIINIESEEIEIYY